MSLARTLPPFTPHARATAPGHARRTRGAVILSTVVVAAGGLTLASLTGCEGVNRASTIDLSKGNTDFTRVRIDAGLRRRVFMESVNTSFASGLLVAQINLKNTGREDQKFAYQILWYTPDGRQVDRESDLWTEDFLIPGQVKSISRTAGSPEATDFILNVRRAK